MPQEVLPLPESADSAQKRPMYLPNLTSLLGGQIHPSPRPYPSHSTTSAQSITSPSRDAPRFSPQQHTVQRSPSIPISRRSDNEPYSRAGPSVPGPKPVHDAPDPREELTTKGRKRKRLAKACAACHKNKRRCDGCAPCANCRFSARECVYLNAQGEVIPPPRTRAQTVQEDSPLRDERKDVSDRIQMREPNRARITTPLTGLTSEDPTKVFEAVQEPCISSQLLDLFMMQVHPFGSMMHRPTFNHRLYLGQIPQLLLDSMYALTPQFADAPGFLRALPPDIRPNQRGNIFAARAGDAIYRALEERQEWTETEMRRSRDHWEELELFQAILLLSVFHVAKNDPERGFEYLDVVINLIASSPLHSSRTVHEDKTGLIERATLDECRNRLIWLVALQDMLAITFGRTRKLPDHILRKIGFPSSEGYWNRYGGALPRERERLYGMSVKASEDHEIGELAHVMRVVSIFSEIVTVAKFSSEREFQVRSPDLEAALKSWAMSLPRNMRFDEQTLSLATSSLNSDIHFVSRAGWLFAFMHSIAECGMFYLQTGLSRHKAAQWTAQRQGQAVENTAVILDAIGLRGRASPLMMTPIGVVSDWQELTRTTDTMPSPHWLLLNDRLTIWRQEAERDWGNYTVPALLPSSRHDDRPPTALGLYNSTSPPIHRAPESSISHLGRSSSSSGPTSMGPLHRSSTMTSLSQDPLIRASQMPTSRSLSASVPSVVSPRFPPLDSRQPGRPPPMMTSYFDLPRSSRPTSEAGSINTARTPISDSPKFDPYAHERQRQEMRTEKTSPNREKRDTMGIAALVSAAAEASEEERARELQWERTS